MILKLACAGTLVLGLSAPARSETVRASWYGGGGERLNPYSADGSLFNQRRPPIIRGFWLVLCPLRIRLVETGESGDMRKLFIGITIFGALLGSRAEASAAPFPLWAIFGPAAARNAPAPRARDKAPPSRHFLASWYGGGEKLARHTANGDRFNPRALTAAHRTFPLGSLVRVCHAGRCVVVRINDRGPAKWTGRAIDLARGAASVIGLTHVGVGPVSIERL